jgi:RNA-splicing ligase RtcB
VPVTEDQLQGVGPFADVLQQMQDMPQYFDQVRHCAKRAWSNLPDSGRESTDSFLQLKQKANELWAEFMAHVKHAISHKIQHADAQRFLVHQIAYEGATKECKQAIRPVKNGDLSTWVSATQTIGTQTYMSTALVAALTKGSPTLSHTTCFGCGQKGH